MMELHNVHQQKIGNSRISISFMINETSFRMLLNFSHDKQVFYPYAITHSGGRKDCCHLCGKEVTVGITFTTCLFFKNRYQELFYRLINMPRIRLEWLYLPHKEKKDETNDQ